MSLPRATQLAGRVHELSIMDDLVRQVTDGRGNVVWVEGESGIGKSTLLGAVMHRLGEAGCTVLGAAGDEFMTDFPLRLMAECLGVSTRSTDADRAELARMLQGDAAGVLSLGAVGERMIALIDRLCASGPVVLTLDDLQWADEASVGLWHRLARSVDQIPLLVMAGCRPTPAHRALRRLRTVVADLGARVIDLGPLDQAAASALATMTLGARPGPRLTAELDRAAGNPLYLRELTEALSRDALLRIAAGEAELVGEAGTTPESLVAAVARRLDFLSEFAHRTLRVAALLGTEFDVAECAVVTGRSTHQLAEMVDEAIATGVLRNEGRRLRFRHELIRQVLVEQSPPAVREEFHRGMARALAEADYDRDVVARHLLAGGRLDAWAANWLAGIPETMVRTTPAVSAELLTRAVAEAGSGGANLPTLRCRLAQAQFWLGRFEESASNAEAVFRAEPGGEVEGVARVQFVRAAGRLGRFTDALAVVTSGLANPDVPPRWRARLAALSTLLLVDLEQEQEARARAEEAFAMARQCDDAFAAAFPYHALAILDPDAQYELRDKAMAVLGTADTDPEVVDLRLVLLARELSELVTDARWSEYDAELPRALVMAERAGTVRGSWIAGEATFASFLRGRWDEAIAHVAGIPEQMNGNPLAYLHGFVATIAYSREQRALAEEHLRLAGYVDGVELADLPFHQRTVVGDALAHAAEAHGDPVRALALRTAWLALTPARQAECVELAPDIVRLALDVGDRDLAATTTACLTATLAPSRFDMVITGCCQAMLADDAEGLLAQAELCRRYGWLPFQAFALEEAAVRLARTGQVKAARTALTTAVRGYAEFDASWRIRRAEARLRPLGVRRGPGGVRQRASHGWAALTRSEQRIVRMIAAGMSNPDIAAELYLSRNTVQTHVSHILAKLGMRSRIEVVREYPRHAERLGGSG
ncbi:helix-turn-helix transcriptional regulator [Micromonospora radicis]|uniref:Helix-turn-helix transcriptional regulator n=1 Tax=Micromonospora radicis TaxID=1894971 RepID=A0A418MQT8_9ACTN|nr:AAA family ATPase [Micromonospora radicis]RIV36047.1 helix-turn-helix transcriptional regulator [Micromonospora radicis]